MMRLAQAAQALGARMVGVDAEFASVSTDSRNIAPGSLFIALRGENFDGAQFVEQAVRDGAVAAMINAGSYRGSAPCPVMLVEDTRLALGRLAAYWRGQFAIPVVALTGSNGKTTVKEMLASILAEQTGAAAGVLATRGNLNNDIGMPLTLLRLDAQHRFAVIEMGMNHPGEIEYLARLARPDVAIVNNASGAHLAGLGTVEAVARAKGEIFAGLSRNGTAVINADDDYAPLWRTLAAGRAIVEFGLSGAPHVHGKWQPEGVGAVIDVRTPRGDFRVALQVPGEHNVRNALAATAAAVALAVPLEKIAAGLEKFGGVAGRLQRKPGRRGAAVVDDTYNANPASMKAAIGVLAQAAGRRILVIGDMGELGADAPRLHAEVGAYARACGIDRLFALGELSREAVRAFGANGRHFDAVDDLCEALQGELAAGVTVLVKGSRFMKMERVVGRCIEGEETCCSH
jgi:UDP-N-acetylmuramoyl-tripeptide--D-alanyl-D-alanine ligase